MATYAVGDVQGCFKSLQRLLASASFDPRRDCLWLAGDLVNRGPDSLAALRFVKSLGESAVLVLGNHDLHLLAVAEGLREANRKDTLDAVLKAPDRDELLHWLRQRPLLHCAQGFAMSHAGIPPMWTLAQAQACARDVETSLRSDNHREFFAHMYGNNPDTWSEDLTGMARLRIITNYFTRMRFCSPQGRLDLKAKEGLNTAPEGMKPWFDQPHLSLNTPILFGHWAALNGKTTHPNAVALDTGCAWGGQLSMVRLEDGVFFRVVSEMAEG